MVKGTVCSGSMEVEGPIALGAKNSATEAADISANDRSSSTPARWKTPLSGLANSEYGTFDIRFISNITGNKIDLTLICQVIQCALPANSLYTPSALRIPVQKSNVASTGNHQVRQ